jgi:hypothetical protein
MISLPVPPRSFWYCRTITTWSVFTRISPPPASSAYFLHFAPWPTSSDPSKTHVAYNISIPHSLRKASFVES